MASRTTNKEIIDFTPYIQKAKKYNEKDLDSFSNELIFLLLKDDLDYEKIKETLGIFLSLFISSISFEKNNKKINKYVAINLFTLFVMTKYKDFSTLIKCIEYIF